MQPLPFEIFPGFSAAASLSLSSDGPIPAAHWAAARDFDSAARPAARARIGRVTPKPWKIVAIMVSIILREVARKGAVLKEDFIRHGLKPADIDRHYPEAIRIAGHEAPGLIRPDAEEAA